MSVGSTYSTAKEAIRAKLAARSGLSAVKVSYQAPMQAADTTGATGLQDAIWLDDATGDYENTVICGLPLRIDENYTIKVVAQSLKASKDGTQKAADIRVDELLYEVMAELATDPTFGVTAFNHFQISHGGFRRITGVLPQGAGHGARCELDLNVEARIVF